MKVKKERSRPQVSHWLQGIWFKGTTFTLSIKYWGKLVSEPAKAPFLGTRDSTHVDRGCLFPSALWLSRTCEWLTWTDKILWITLQHYNVGLSRPEFPEKFLEVSPCVPLRALSCWAAENPHRDTGRGQMQMSFWQKLKITAWDKKTDRQPSWAGSSVAPCFMC